MAQYNEFLESPRADPGYARTGRLDVATTDEGATALRQHVERRGNRAADTERSQVDESPVDYIPPDALRESVLVPFLDTDVLAGSVFRPQVGYLRPREMALEFIERARDHGVTFHEDAAVSDITVDEGAVTGLTVNGSEWATDGVISAAGPWNLRVAAMAGLDIPVRHTLAPVLELAPAEPIPYDLPWITHRESGVSIRRNPDGNVLVTHHPPDRYAAATEYDPDEVDEIPGELRQQLCSTVERLLPTVESFDVVDERIGIRSSTPDGNPVVGWTSVKGFSVAAFSTSGIQLAPATGAVVAAQLVDGEPTDYYDGLSISRFDDHADHR